MNDIDSSVDNISVEEIQANPSKEKQPSLFFYWFSIGWLFSGFYNIFILFLILLLISCCFSFGVLPNNSVLTILDLLGCFLAFFSTLFIIRRFYVSPLKASLACKLVGICFVILGIVFNIAGKKDIVNILGGFLLIIASKTRFFIYNPISSSKVWIKYLLFFLFLAIQSAALTYLKEFVTPQYAALYYMDINNTLEDAPSSITDSASEPKQNSWDKVVCSLWNASSDDYDRVHIYNQDGDLASYLDSLNVNEKKDVRLPLGEYEVLYYTKSGERRTHSFSVTDYNDGLFVSLP